MRDCVIIFICQRSFVAKESQKRSKNIDTLLVLILSVD